MLKFLKIIDSTELILVVHIKEQTFEKVEKMRIN